MVRRFRAVHGRRSNVPYRFWSPAVLRPRPLVETTGGHFACRVLPFSVSFGPSAKRIARNGQEKTPRAFRTLCPGGGEEEATRYTYDQAETVFQRGTMAPDVVEEHGKLSQVERVRQTRAHDETPPRKQRGHRS